MTLTNRLLVFFLSILAIVLIGFSAALYFLAVNYLHEQTNERLASVLNTIGGAIENDSEGVEWEPMEREQSLQFSAFEDQVVWIVADSHENVVARSNGSSAAEFHKRISPSMNKRLDFSSRRSTSMNYAS